MFKNYQYILKKYMFLFGATLWLASSIYVIYYIPKILFGLINEYGIFSSNNTEFIIINILVVLTQVIFGFLIGYYNMSFFIDRKKKMQL